MIKYKNMININYDGKNEGGKSKRVE